MIVSTQVDLPRLDGRLRLVHNIEITDQHMDERRAATGSAGRDDWIRRSRPMDERCDVGSLAPTNTWMSTARRPDPQVAADG
jgi:hypothetical protein